MNKELTPLEALWRLYKYPSLAHKNVFAYFSEQENLGKYKNIVEKALKALEIIKEKNVNCDLVRQTKNVYEYNKVVGGLGVIGARHFNLTQEEYDLLKEVLL